MSLAGTDEVERAQAGADAQRASSVIISGDPRRLPESEQSSHRIARALETAARSLGAGAVAAWMSAPNDELGGLEPESLAGHSEDGCQEVLRLLVRLGRCRGGESV